MDLSSDSQRVAIEMMSRWARGKFNPEVAPLFDAADRALYTHMKIDDSLGVFVVLLREILLSLTRSRRRRSYNTDSMEQAD